MKLKAKHFLLMNWVTFIAFMAILALIALHREQSINRRFVAQHIEQANRQFMLELRDFDRGLASTPGRCRPLHRRGAAYMATNGPAADLNVLRATLTAAAQSGDTINVSLISSNLVVIRSTGAWEPGLDLSRSVLAAAHGRAAQAHGTIVFVHPVFDAQHAAMCIYSLSWMPSLGMYLQLQYRTAAGDSGWLDVQRLARENAIVSNIGIYLVMQAPETNQVVCTDLCAPLTPVTALQQSNIVAALDRPASFVVAGHPDAPHVSNYYFCPVRIPRQLFSLQDMDAHLVFRLPVNTGAGYGLWQSWLLMLGLLLVFAVLSMLEYMFIVRQYVQPLHAARQMLQGVLDTIPVRVFWKDRSSRFLGSNRMFATDAGLASPEMIVGRTDDEMDWAQFAEQYRADDRAVMASATPKLAIEEPYVLPGGHPGWLRTSKIPLRDERNRITGVLCMAEDITEWKKNHEDLQRHAHFEQTIARISSRLLDATDIATVIETSLADICAALATDRATLVRVGADTRTIETVYQWHKDSAPDSRAALLGMHITDGAWDMERVMSLTGLMLNDIDHMPDEAAQERATYARMGIRAIMGAPLRKFGRETGFMTTTMLTSTRVWRDDEFVFLFSCAQMLSGALERHDILRELQQQRDTLEQQVAARTAALQSTNQWLEREIDERLLAEDSLRHSETLYLTTINSLRDWVHVIDGDFRILFANTAFEHAIRDYRVSPGLVGQNLFDAMPFLGNKVRGEYQKVFATGNAVITQEITNVNGRQVFTETKKTPVVVNDSVVRIVTYISDITEQKLAEKTLQDSEAQYRVLFTGSPTALTEFDAHEAFAFIARLRQEGVVDLGAHFTEHPGLVRECAAKHIVRAANDRMMELFGAHSLEELQQRRSEVYREETIAMIAAYLVAMDSGATSFQAETVINTFGGDIRYCIASFTILPRYKPSDTRIILALVDITARKQIEEALRQSEAKFITAFKSNPSLMAIGTMSDMRMLEVNDAYVNVLGYSREELYGRTASDVGIWRDQDQRNEARRLLQSEGFLSGFQVTCHAKDGSVRTMLLSANPATIEGQPCLITAAIDITDRVRAEEALGQSETKFITAFRSNPSLIAIIKPDGTLVDCNDAYAAVFGRSREELVGTSDVATNVWVDERQRAQALDILSRTGRLRAFEMQFRTRRGEIRSGLMSAEPMLINGEQHLITAAIDITDRVQTRQALAASEERFRSLFENNPIAMTEVDWSALRDDILALHNVTDDIENYLACHTDLTEAIYAKRRVLAINKAMRDLFGAASSEEAMEKMAAASSPNNFTPFNFHVATIARGEHECETERSMHMPDGRDLVLLIRISVAPGAEQTWKRIIVSALDITERRKAELQLRDYESQLRALASELTLAEERERRRIAAGLHDDVSQTLALAKMKLGMVPAARASKQHLDSVREALDHAIASVRSLTFELSPPALHEIGLPAALDWLADRTQRLHGVACTFTVRSKIPALDETLRTMLYLIAQELLVNVVKHAEATRATIALALHDHVLSMEIADNGKGLPPVVVTSTTMQDGFGLFSVRERLKFLGASLDIRAKQGKGTTVLINVPLAPGHSPASPDNAGNLQPAGTQ